MDNIRLLIADADERFTRQVTFSLRRYSDVEIIAVEKSGREALNRVLRCHPDAVLFDLVLPDLDGISLLRNINELQEAPAAICCTRFYSDVSLEAARIFGASYLLYKPIEMQTLHPVLCSCCEMHRNLRRLKKELAEGALQGENQSAYIRNYIVSLGIPTKLIGCSYLTEAVRLARADMTLLRNLSKGLYLEISRSMSTTPARIERCIRTAVNAAFQQGELRSRMPDCPSNKEFINYVLRNMQ